MKLGISASVLLTCFLIYLVFNLLKTNLLLKIGLSHMASIPGTAMALYVTGTTTDNMVLILLSFIAPAVLFSVGAALSLIGALAHSRQKQA